MHRVTEILYAVADHFNMEPTTLMLKSHAQKYARPRQIAMYLCREHTSCSLPDLGTRFGGMHHTTILYGAERIAELRTERPALNESIEQIEAWLRAKWTERAAQPTVVGFTPLADIWVGHTTRLLAGKTAYLNTLEAAQVSTMTNLDAARVTAPVNDAMHDILEYAGVAQ